MKKGKKKGRKKKKKGKVKGTGRYTEGMKKIKQIRADQIISSLLLKIHLKV